jgi:hypothetical protein
LPGYNLKTFIPAKREAAGDMGSRNDSEGDIEKVIFKLLTVYFQLIDIRPATSYWHTWSNKVALSTNPHKRDTNSQL